MTHTKLIPRLRFSGFSDEWTVKKLGDIGPVSMCKRILKDQTEPNGDVPFYKIGTFGRTPDAYIDSGIYERYKVKYSFPNKGDILISAAGTIGRLVVYDGKPAYFQDSNIVWIANNEEQVINEFLYLCYLNTNWRTEDTTIARLYNDNLRTVTISVPAIPEQEKIADFLGITNDRVEVLRKKVKFLKQYKKGVMEKLFNKQISFPSSENSKMMSLGELVKYFSTGLNPRKNFLLGTGNNYYVTIKNINNGSLDFTTAEKVDDNAVAMIAKRSKLEKDDIIMSSIGNIGEAYLLDKDPEGWNINESVFAIKPDKAIASPKYVYQLLSSGSARRYFESNSTGSSFKSIKMAQLKQLQVPVPGLKQQEKIANFLSLLDHKITITEVKLAQAELFKKSLLQRLFV